MLDNIGINVVSEPRYLADQIPVYGQTTGLQTQPISIFNVYCTTSDNVISSIPNIMAFRAEPVTLFTNEMPAALPYKSTRRSGNSDLRP